MKRFHYLQIILYRYLTFLDKVHLSSYIRVLTYVIVIPIVLSNMKI